VGDKEGPGTEHLEMGRHEEPSYVADVCERYRALDNVPLQVARLLVTNLSHLRKGKDESLRTGGVA
jgi:hypothetical protein